MKFKITKENTGNFIFHDEEQREIRFIPDWDLLIKKTKNGEVLSYNIIADLKGRENDKTSLRFVNEAISWMFNETPCLQVVTYQNEEQVDKFSTFSEWNVLDTIVEDDQKIIKKGISIGKWIRIRGEIVNKKALLKKGKK